MPVAEGKKRRGTAANHATSVGFSGGGAKLSAPVATQQYAFLDAAPVPVLPSTQRTVSDTKQGQPTCVQLL